MVGRESETADVSHGIDQFGLRLPLFPFRPDKSNVGLFYDTILAMSSAII
jgi:hypothetical protein